LVFEIPNTQKFEVFEKVFKYANYDRYLVFGIWCLQKYLLTTLTAEALRAKIERKSMMSLKCGHFDPKFQVEGVVSHQSLLHR